MSRRLGPWTTLADEGSKACVRRAMLSREGTAILKPLLSSVTALEGARDPGCGSSSMLLTRLIVVTRRGASIRDDRRLWLLSSSSGSSVFARRVLSSAVFLP